MNAILKRLETCKKTPQKYKLAGTHSFETLEIMVPRSIWHPNSPRLSAGVLIHASIHPSISFDPGVYPSKHRMGCQSIIAQTRSRKILRHSIHVEWLESIPGSMRHGDGVPFHHRTVGDSET